MDGHLEKELFGGGFARWLDVLVNGREDGRVLGVSFWRRGKMGLFV